MKQIEFEIYKLISGIVFELRSIVSRIYCLSDSLSVATHGANSIRAVKGEPRKSLKTDGQASFR